MHIEQYDIAKYDEYINGYHRKVKKYKLLVLLGVTIDG